MLKYRACFDINVFGLLILVISSCLAPISCDDTCICENKSWCKPITKTYQQEVFVFSVSSTNWMLYDWNKITTIAEVGYHNKSLLCHAHSMGVRVVSLVNFHPPSQLVNLTARSEWVKTSLQYMAENHLDGINVDFESPIYNNQTDIRGGLTALVQELSKAMKKQFPKSQLTFDFAWSPECIDKRCYDYKSLTDIVDFAFVMAYSERSQIFGACVAWANAAMNQTISGLDAYEKLGVPLKNVVLGVPWYGYIYSCVRYEEETRTCYIKEVPFRGVNCSDAGGKGVTYSETVETLLPNSVSGRLWDDQAKSPYFIYQDSATKQISQVWYDDPTSLKLKYNYARDRGLRGVGMWEADQLDYTDTSRGKEQREAMWGALP